MCNLEILWQRVPEAVTLPHLVQSSKGVNHACISEVVGIARRSLHDSLVPAYGASKPLRGNGIPAVIEGFIAEQAR